MILPFIGCRTYVLRSLYLGHSAGDARSGTGSTRRDVLLAAGWRHAQPVSHTACPYSVQHVASAVCAIIKFYLSSRNVALSRLSSASPALAQRLTRRHVDWTAQHVGCGAGTRHCVIDDVNDQLTQQPVVDRSALLRHRCCAHLWLLHHTHDRLADSKEQARQRRLQVVLWQRRRLQVDNTTVSLK